MIDAVQIGWVAKIHCFNLFLFSPSNSDRHEYHAKLQIREMSVKI